MPVPGGARRAAGAVRWTRWREWPGIARRLLALCLYAVILVGVAAAALCGFLDGPFRTTLRQVQAAQHALEDAWPLVQSVGTNFARGGRAVWAWSASPWTELVPAAEPKAETKAEPKGVFGKVSYCDYPTPTCFRSSSLSLPHSRIQFCRYMPSFAAIVVRSLRLLIALPWLAPPRPLATYALVSL